MIETMMGPMIEPAIGQRVDYRFWDSNPWQTGTVIDIYAGSHSGNTYVQVKRDGYRETAVLPGSVISPATYRVHN